MTRYATRQQVIDSLAGVFGDFAADYDLDAIIDETYAYRVDEDEDGPVCEDCAEALSEDEATVSLSYLGRLLCEGCGKYEA